MAPWASGMVNRPWTDPWPSEESVRRIFCRARASSASSFLRSWSSATWGARCSRIARPRMRRVLASWVRARSTRCSSACDDEVGGRSSGSSSRAWTMTPTWSRFAAPGGGRGPHAPPPLLDGVPERHLVVGGSADLLGRAGPPRAGGHRARLLPDPDLVGDDRDLQRQRVHPCPQPRQRDQRLPRRSRVQPDQGALEEVADAGVEGADLLGHGVPGAGVVAVDHGSIVAPAADIGAGQRGLCTTRRATRDLRFDNRFDGALDG